MTRSAIQPGVLMLAVAWVAMSARPAVAIDPVAADVESASTLAPEPGASHERPSDVDLPGPPEGDTVVTSEEASPLDPAEPGPDTLDLETLRELVQQNPAALGSLSIGTPDAGLLLNPQPMPEGPLWTIRNTHEAYGTEETVDFIRTAIEAVHRRHPSSPRLVIGDLSGDDGGRLNRHRSHQSGRDVDLGLYLLGGDREDFERGRAGRIDLPRTWALVRSLITETDVDRIFLDRSIQRLLFAEALSEGENVEWLDDIFGRRTGGVGALIQHERRHLDHMHVRFYNARAQELGRVAYPLLVNAGVVPGPTMTHRARRGDTLSTIARRYGTSVARVRAANGLKGSSLRAGRVYVIPVRRPLTAGEPLLIPPRRVPPGAPATAEVTPSDLPAPKHTGGF